jgi:hypothetical protein
MRYGTLLIALLMPALSACDSMPLSMMVDRLSNKHQITASDRSAIEKSLTAFFGAKPSSFEIKAAGASDDPVTICGSTGKVTDKRTFFVGELHRNPNGEPDFIVKLTWDAQTMAPRLRSYPDKLCKA